VGISSPCNAMMMVRWRRLNENQSDVTFELFTVCFCTQYKLSLLLIERCSAFGNCIYFGLYVCLLDLICVEKFNVMRF